jgi:FtsP/CotA-like multicopper oxidase with cupredoxin domain
MTGGETSTVQRPAKSPAEARYKKRCLKEALRRVAGFVAFAAIAMLAGQAQAQGQFIPCAPFGQPLVKIPELISDQGKLKKTILLVDVAQRTNLAPDPTDLNNCVPQSVRNFKGDGAVLPAYPGVAPGDGYTRPAPVSAFFADPIPGPTLRARVGDLIQLTFINQVDAAFHAGTLDKGANEAACDQSTLGGAGPYPQNAHEIYPNCFHGSSSANIHFHGTHTNPNSTGDNVFLNIAPALRPLPGRQPTVTPQSVEPAFTEFFRNCETHLGNDFLLEWPYRWEDFPEAYREQQKTDLGKLDDALPPQAEKLWIANEEQIVQGKFPQYYIGAFPYCFRLPVYVAGSWPPKPMPAAGTPTRTAPRLLQMGQSPGTHWYHAHKHGSTTINVMNGMTGAFIIEGSYDDDLNRYYGTMPAQPAPGPPVPWTRAQPILVINELGVSPVLLGGGSDPLSLPVSVNGRIAPVLTMRPGEVQLWRIVNTSARSFVNLVGPPKDFHWRQLAQDGVQFAQENYERSADTPSLLLAPGNRVDLLVKAPAAAAAGLTPVQVQRVVSRAGLTANKPVPETLFSIDIAGDPPSNLRQTQFIAEAPAQPSFLADITDKEITGTKVISFNSKPLKAEAQHTIDGKQYDGEVGQVVLLNKAEEWQIVNTTVKGQQLGPGRSAIDHPFHIHINPFQVTEVFDPNELITDPKNGQPVIDPATNKPIPRYVFDPAAKKRPDQCYIDPRLQPADFKLCTASGPQANLVWWDVFPIPAGTVATNANGQPLKDDAGKPLVVGGYFKMRSRFVDYPGLFVIHCHILAHEDRGMMTVVDVRPLGAPMKHH